MAASKSDTDLPIQMANLGIMEVDNTENNESSDNISQLPSRLLRKRKSIAIENVKRTNRRVSMKPRKHIVSECASPKQIESLYLNKSIKLSSQSLETIHEDTKVEVEDCDSTVSIGGRKLKRLLAFHVGTQYTKEKIKKRRAKIKKLFGNKSFLNRKKIPMDVFLNTIENLNLDECRDTTNSGSKL